MGLPNCPKRRNCEKKNPPPSLQLYGGKEENEGKPRELEDERPRVTLRGNVRDRESRTHSRPHTPCVSPRTLPDMPSRLPPNPGASKISRRPRPLPLFNTPLSQPNPPIPPPPFSLPPPPPTTSYLLLPSSPPLHNARGRE
ncbi:hypothetical protein J437_LFUL000447 [Ladona fulva]|uniref:Uncharacterized protein n=1 Tax=Ladona fulva TaxID=123851 RepID=A0A8K0K3S1_LADFU|nr:hypothetical protein J437_LFUL000447 [Ladona fulva]